MKGFFVLSLLVLVALSFAGVDGESTCAIQLASCPTNPPDAYMACIDKSFIQAVSSFLPEGKAVDKKYLNPKDWNPNVIFDFTNESQVSGQDVKTFKGYINITLFWEGAGYRNQFGYFFYETDSKGENPKIKKDSKGDKMQYILFKDVSFPNADKSKDKGACLQSGVSVDIGPFRHGDNIGFVVWPNWYNSQSLKPLYSIPALNDKDEVHFFVFSLQDKFVLGIEDVLLGSADKDYNDVVFQFQTTKGATVEVPKLDPCPGEVPCNGHGICNATSKSCICQSGPTATYFGTNCENSYICECQQGTCVSNGVCSCDDRFGSDCSSCAEGKFGYPTCKSCDTFCKKDQTCQDSGAGVVTCLDPPEKEKTPQCATEPWGVDASAYSVFVRGGFEGYNSDVQGRIAAGGDINLSLYSLAEGLNPNDDDTLSCNTLKPSWAAVSGGSFTWDNGNARIGNLGYGGTNKIDSSVASGLGADCSVLSTKSAVNFKDAFDYLASVSSYFAKKGANGETYLDKKEKDNNKKTLYLNAPKSQPSDFLFIFDVKGDDLLDATSVIFGGFNDMAVKMIIINVDNDGKFNFRDTSFDTVLQGPSVNLGQKIVWNFFNADSIRIKSLALPGVLLAPSSFVKGTNAVLWGQIYAASFEGDLQVNFPVGGEKLCFMTDIIEKIPKTSAACPPCSEDATQKDDCTCVCKRTCPAPFFADPTGDCGCVCPVNNDCVLGQDPETCLCYGASTPAIDSSYCYDSYDSESAAWPAWMTDFQIVTKKDLTLKSTRTGGRIAAGGDSKLQRIAVGDRLSQSKNPDCAATNGKIVPGVILANGPLFFQSGSVSGNILAGSYTQLSDYLSFPLQVKQGLLGCDLPLPKKGDWDFEAGFKQLQSFSNVLGDDVRTSTTGQAIYAYDVLTLWGYGKDLEVFRVSSDVLKKARRIDLKGIKSTATIIIDIQGDSVSIRDVGTASLLPFARSLIWNAAKAGTFSFKNVALPGLIVAPNAVIENPVGRLLGGAFVSSFTAKGNVGIEWPFSNWAGCLPRPDLLVKCDACPAGQKRLNPTNCDCTSVVNVRTSSVGNFYGGAVVTYKFDITGQPPTAVTVNFPDDGVCKIQLNADNKSPNVFTLQQKSGGSGYTFVTPSYAGFSADGLSFVAVFENKEAGEFPCETIPIPNIVSVSYEPITADD